MKLMAIILAGQTACFAAHMMFFAHEPSISRGLWVAAWFPIVAISAWALGEENRA